MELTLYELFIVGMTAAACAALVLGFFRLLDSLWPATGTGSTTGQLSFLVQNEELIDATPEGYALLSHAHSSRPDRVGVIEVLRATFPDLEAVMQYSQVDDTILEASDGTGKYLEIKSHGAAINLTVKGQQTHDLLYLHQLRSANNTVELSTLRTAVENNPQLMWQLDNSGQLVWANSAYLNVADRLGPHPENKSIPTLPSVRPFETYEAKLIDSEADMRVAIPAETVGEEDWFDLEVIETQTGRLFYAQDVNAVVMSEISQKKFLRTISQTFAQLSIGLAIFDRGRRLSTFNPALIDLTSLPVDFLSSQPSLDMILDRLRETRMLPEPKDYSQWRDGFSRLEVEARNGTYSENWNLPDGQTYRVTGRPHPDGAFALLFEDISAEISLTRRFRTEIETSQAVLDKIGDAVAVFSNTGNLVMSNQPYEDLWEASSGNGIIQSDLRSEISSWKSRCAPTRIWQSLRGFVQQSGPRDPWSEIVMLDDGRPLHCAAEAIAGGMTMVRFTFESSQSIRLRDVNDKIESQVSAEA